MAKKDSLLSRLFPRKKDPEDLGDMDLGTHHSNYYHSFFQGYQEEYTYRTDRKGRRKRTILRTYVGEYYIRKCTDKQWKILKIAYPAVYLTAVLLFVLVSAQSLPLNRLWYVNVPQAVGVLVSLVSFFMLFSCAFRPRRMTVYEYRTSFGRAKVCCPLTCAVYGLTAVTIACGMVKGYAEGGAVSLLLCLLAAALSMVDFLLEKRADYERTAKSEISDNSVVIS